MTDHLPECVSRSEDYGIEFVCVCRELRKCEQRMLDDDVLAAAYHGQAGYVAGVQAAREAVAALVPFPQPVTPTLADALAAIDALKETADE